MTTRVLSKLLGARRAGAGLFVLSLGACDTFSEPAAAPPPGFNDGVQFPDPSSGGAAGVSGTGTFGATGGGGTGGTIGFGGTGGSAGGCPEVDRDGDGAPAPADGCTLVPVPNGTTDCNDFDASLQLAAFVDADGDGAGDPESPACLPPSPGVGFSVLGTDCNDTDPDISPNAIDVAGDGVDKNCDSEDGDLDCSVATWCPCNQALATEVDTSNACDGFDLVIYEVLGCSSGGCGGSASYVRVANIGKKDATGRITLTGTSGAPRAILDGLAAGQITQPFYWPEPPITGVRIASSDPGDCDPSNDVYEEMSGGLAPQCPK